MRRARVGIRMNKSKSYYRLIIRFTNGETQRFIMREPIDTAGISDRTRYALVRTLGPSSDIPDILLAALSDVSFIKTERIEGKELRHRVAGIASAVSTDEDVPDEVSTVEFV
jgi:hypothetical protein